MPPLDAFIKYHTVISHNVIFTKFINYPTQKIFEKQLNYPAPIVQQAAGDPGSLRHQAIAFVILVIFRRHRFD
jgi:hypothetical protein